MAVPRESTIVIHDGHLTPPIKERAQAGRLPTGILGPLRKGAGRNSVTGSDLLVLTIRLRATSVSSKE